MTADRAVLAGRSHPVTSDQSTRRAYARLGITWPEWRSVALLAACIFALTQAPPTAERLFGSTDRVHVGTYWYWADFSQYLSAMREAATTGSLLVHDHLTAEPHTPALIYPLYAAIGVAAAASGLPILSVYTIVEALARLALPFAIYAYMASLLERPGARIAATLLAIFAASLGIWALFVSKLLNLGLVDDRALNTTVEATTFGLFFIAPHVPLGLAATLVAALLYVRAAT
ncbi:MAG: hypothetical protein QOF51_1560, partial [Chloroflexota bacterium]|nr:hypothetical protein [Chloroflexota bacterium]